MSDPMTQSYQISSSQGLNDGHSKDSKVSDSFFSSSPVSFIQSPQDKTVALDIDRPPDSVATSLRFSSQIGSFSPVTYGGELVGNKNDSCNETQEHFDSTCLSQMEDTVPIKVSPVSERIKALEALAAKQNHLDWSDGGLSHFRDRHHGKSSTEVHGISANSSVKKVSTLTKQDSPESPFEILGEAGRGNDFEDTTDWMRVHMPPAPNFNIEETNINEVRHSSLMDGSLCEEANSLDTNVTDVTEDFVNVPKEFSDNPTKITTHINEFNQSKQDSVEEESEFDLRFLPTAYMSDKPEKFDVDSQNPTNNCESKDLKENAPAAPPAGFESDTMISLAPVSQKNSSQNQKTEVLDGDTVPVQTEVDSSGDSDDTVIDYAYDHCNVADTDAVDCGSPPTTQGPLHEPIKQVIQVPIINVIETEEQVLSDYEMEHEEEDEEWKFQITQELTKKEASPLSEEHSEDLKSIPEVSLETKDNSVQANESVFENSLEQNLKDYIDEETLKQATFEPECPGAEDNQSQDSVSQDANEISREFSNDPLQTKMEETLVDLPTSFENISNSVESSNMDTNFNHITCEDQALMDQLNLDQFTENNNEISNFVSDSHLDNQNSIKLAEVLCEEMVVVEFNELITEDKLNCNTALEPSSDTLHFPQDAQFEGGNVDVADEQTISGSSSCSLMTEEDFTTPPAAVSTSVLEDAPVSLLSFHNDPPSTNTEVISNISPIDKSEESVLTNPEQRNVSQHDSQISAEITSKHNSSELSTIESTDSFVEFMRECLKSQVDEEFKRTDTEHINKKNPCPPITTNLEQENVMISPVKLLNNNQEDENEINIQNEHVASSKDAQIQPAVFSLQQLPDSIPTEFPNEYISDISLSREIEAIDIWVAEAYHLAEHVLAQILTHLSVHDLVYWRDPKKSGVVFGTSLLLLLSLAAFSVISVVSYLLLALLCVTISFRVYKSVIQAVQKTNEGHPFKELMERDVSLPPETFRKHVDSILTYINCGLKKLCRLFLVEDLVDSLKLAVVMWLLTYVGAVFNGITVLILVDIVAFTVPPLYEKYKTQIDRCVNTAQTHINSVVAKIREKLPRASKRSKTE